MWLTMFSFQFLKSIFLCLVLAAVRRNQLTRNAPDNDLETCIRKWLEGSGDRSGGRRERLQLRLSSANPRWVLSRKRWGVRLIPDQGFFFLTALCVYLPLHWESSPKTKETFSWLLWFQGSSVRRRWGQKRQRQVLKELQCRVSLV